MLDGWVGAVIQRQARSVESLPTLAVTSTGCSRSSCALRRGAGAGGGFSISGLAVSCFRGADLSGLQEADSADRTDAMYDASTIFDAGFELNAMVYLPEAHPHLALAAGSQPCCCSTDTGGRSARSAGARVGCASTFRWSAGAAALVVALR